MAKKSKLESLKDAGRELNKVLNPDPQIKTGKKADAKEITAMLKEAADLLEPGDTLSDGTRAVLVSIKAKVPAAAKKKVARGEKETGKKEKGKKGKGAKAPEPKREKEEVETDDFGFKVGTKASLFANEVKKAGKKGTTMAAIAKCKWNENGASYNGTLSKMVQAGHAEKRDGKFYIVK